MDIYYTRLCLADGDTGSRITVLKVRIILLVFVFALNFIVTWVIPIACDCAWVAQVLVVDNSSHTLFFLVVDMTPFSSRQQVGCRQINIYSLWWLSRTLAVSNEPHFDFLTRRSFCPRLFN